MIGTAHCFERCQRHGALPLSSPFDAEAVDFLDGLGLPGFKIASFEITDLPLIRHAASKGKPLILSTGMASLQEIEAAVEAARGAGAPEVVLLRCTSTYPADPDDSDLRALPDLAARFGTHVGLSDHTFGIGAAVGAVALGAVVIEKHVTLRRADGGVDSAFSLEPLELAALVVESERAWRALGQVRYGPKEREKPSLQFRRSLWVCRDFAAGETIRAEHVRCLRPAGGLEPDALDQVIGRQAVKSARRGDPFLWDLVEADRGAS